MKQKEPDLVIHGMEELKAFTKQFGDSGLVMDIQLAGWEKNEEPDTKQEGNKTKEK